MFDLLRLEGVKEVVIFSTGRGRPTRPLCCTQRWRAGKLLPHPPQAKGGQGGKGPNEKQSREEKAKGGKE